MTGNEIRKQFLKFFKDRGHTIIPSASLVPADDPTVLFTTAGMHPLVPYLLGEKHPGGKRLANVQKCIRTQDIEEVGDNRHDTFFEMLGNWSFGDYFKKEAIEWSFEFLTDPDWLSLDPDRIYISVFSGDEDAPKDEESIGLWQKQFEKFGLDADVGERIFTYGRDKNWWGPAGQTGPCGPDTEMFYDLQIAHDSDFGAECHPNCDCGRFVEIWNDVFMEYNKTEDGTYEPLAQKNVDTGMGLERVAMILQDKENIFDADLFSPMMEQIAKLSHNRDARSERIVADHIRSATFIISDGVAPTNLDRGYVLRRLIRRAVNYARKLGMPDGSLSLLAKTVIDMYGDVYSNLKEKESEIISELEQEEERFEKTLERGLKEFEKIAAVGGVREIITGDEAFLLFSTYGFPLELTKELAADRNIDIDEKAFWDEFKKHQELSRSGSSEKFFGGLADHSEETTKLHTATHLMHRALKDVLGDHVEQRGSNITKDRLRFDFSHPQKMTDEEKKKVEEIVNKIIQDDLPVSCVEMTPSDAKASGALGYFEDKYAKLEKVKVYTVGDKDGGIFSVEICGGPHVEHTGEIGEFRIKKEESASSGIRRIKAVVTGLKNSKN